MAIRYPAEFTAGQATDYLEIKRVRRDYTSSNSNGFQAGENIILNVPQKIVESFGQSWRNSTLGPEASDILYGRSSFAANPGDFAVQIGKRLLENYALNQATSAFGKIGASNLSENSILSGTSGIIYNPNMEVLYDGPQFRQFNFQFTLFAKSKTDAENIHKIVRFFQKASVPSITGAEASASKLSNVIQSSSAVNVAQDVASQFTDFAKNPGSFNPSNLFGTLFSSVGSGIAANATLGGVFFSGERFIKQPPFLVLTFKRGSNVHPYILPTKPCAINNLSIDYTPTGNYTVLNNFGQEEVATVVVTNISVSLTEIKTVFEEDYQDPSSFSGVLYSNY